MEVHRQCQKSVNFEENKKFIIIKNKNTKIVQRQTPMCNSMQRKDGIANRTRSNEDKYQHYQIQNGYTSNIFVDFKNANQIQFKRKSNAHLP